MRLLVVAALLAPALTSQAQIGIGTTTPNPSAALDIQSSSLGFLLPRVALQNVNDGGTISKPAPALLVYNTSNTLNGAGFYYNAGTAALPSWQSFVTTGSPVGQEFWGLNGTNALSTNYMGTINGQDLAFRVNNVERLRMNMAGNLVTSAGMKVGIGTSAPSNTLHLAGNSSSVRVEGLGGGGVRYLTTDDTGVIKTGTVAPGTGNDFILNQNGLQVGNFNISGSGRVGGNMSVGNNLTVEENITVRKDLTVERNMTVMGNSTNNGNSTFNGSTTFNGITSLSGSNTSISGNTTLATLIGSGTRMVVASGSGLLSSQVLPTLSISGTTLTLAGANAVTLPTSIGPTGPQGPIGLIGPQGPIGLNGAQGPTGSIGPTGAQGSIGLIGLQGPIGLTGAQGPIGPKGDAGATGAAGPKGDTGAAGATGAQGATGATGAAGPKGDAGSAGATGPAGAIGATGSAGSAGAVGATGSAGATGSDGATGSPGATGVAGPAGSSASMVSTDLSSLTLPAPGTAGSLLYVRYTGTVGGLLTLNGSSGVLIALGSAAAASSISLIFGSVVGVAQLLYDGNVWVVVSVQ